MAVELIFASEVEQDIGEAYAWYEKRRPGLGEAFPSCVDACLQNICWSPEIFAKVHDHYRRALVRRFPYAIFYEQSGQTVTTYYSIFHTARNPNKWRERLP